MFSERKRDSFRFPEQDLENNKLAYIQAGNFQKLKISRRVEVWIKCDRNLVLICVAGAPSLRDCSNNNGWVDNYGNSGTFLDSDFFTYQASLSVDTGSD
jgi:hypothetical protein